MNDLIYGPAFPQIPFSIWVLARLEIGELGILHRLYFQRVRVLDQCMKIHPDFASPTRKVNPMFWGGRTEISMTIKQIRAIVGEPIEREYVEEFDSKSGIHLLPGLSFQTAMHQVSTLLNRWPTPEKPPLEKVGRMFLEVLPGSDLPMAWAKIHALRGRFSPPDMRAQAQSAEADEVEKFRKVLVARAAETSKKEEEGSKSKTPTQEKS